MSFLEGQGVGTIPGSVCYMGLTFINTAVKFGYSFHILLVSAVSPANLKDSYAALSVP